MIAITTSSSTNVNALRFETCNFSLERKFDCKMPGDSLRPTWPGTTVELTQSELAAGGFRRRPF